MRVVQQRDAFSINFRRVGTIERFLPSCVLGIILLFVALAYISGLKDTNYESDDYVFLAQVTQNGLLKTLLIPFRDHFFPLFRLLMGASHLLWRNAAPFRLIILVFHLATTGLIFHIVRNETKQIIPAMIASATYGLSPQASHCILWCVTASFGMSLFFALLMYIYLEKAAAHQENIETLSGAKKKYLMAGIVLFAIAMGFSVIALIGGFLVWAFWVLRVCLYRKSSRIRACMLYSLPFVLVAISYLLLRYYCNRLFLAYQDDFFLNTISKPAFSFEQKLDIFKLIPKPFYVAAASNMLPYFPDHYLAALAVVAALEAKEFVCRRSAAYLTFFWLFFSILTLAVPLMGRILYTTRVAGYPLFIIAPHYYSYSIAGLSIAFGLLLRQPKHLRKLAPALQFASFAFIAFLLILITRPNFLNIRLEIARRTEQNGKFHNVVTQYKESMDAFSHSDKFEPQCPYYFEDGPTAEWPKYLSSWGVTHGILFNFLFPDVENIHFVSGADDTSTLRQWRPASTSMGDTLPEGKAAEPALDRKTKM
jgi:hypothetical protein